MPNRLKNEPTEASDAEAASPTAQTRSFALSLREIRKERNLSLQDVADRAGVSKSMVSKIERGDAHPSLDVAVRIAASLDAPLVEMIRPVRRPAITLLAAAHQPVVMGPEGAWEERTLSPASKADELVILRLTFAAKGALTLPGALDAADKYLVLLSGRVTVRAGETCLVLAEGDAAHVQGGVECIIDNQTGRNASAMLVASH